MVRIVLNTVSIVTTVLKMLSIFFFHGSTAIVGLGLLVVEATMSYSDTSHLV